jgi:glutamate/tyrosine decarboxylase-like PLP-dependent enzyme
MNQKLKNDLEGITSILEAIKRQSIDYLNGLDELPTSRVDQHVAVTGLCQSGLGAQKTLELFNDHYKKLMVSSAGPRYWGFVVGGVTPAALAGDWLTSVFDQNTQTTQGNGDISAILEIQTIRLMTELLGLPETFNGGFVTGATMSNFTGLAVGRQWGGVQLGKDIARDGMTGELVVLSATPHSSVIKSLSMLGFGSNNIVKIKNLAGREAIDLDDLEQNLIQLEGKSVILSCSAGTVNTVDFDDLAAIVSLKTRYKFWMHVDAAFGGFAACSEHYKHLVAGWEFADSITIDCHKWMNLPYDSAVFLVQKEHELLQLQTFQNSNAPYLGNLIEDFSYLNFLPENSRRFRALPAWFSLMAYGKDGFRWIVENNITCANSFGDYLDKSPDFVLIAPVRLNVVCFQLKDEEKTSVFLDIFNKRGRVFMTPTVLNGSMCIRAAFVNFRTSDKDIAIAIHELEETLKQL